MREVGSRMLSRVLTGEVLSSGWVIMQDGIYPCAVAQVDVILFRTVRFETSPQRGIGASTDGPC
jgi:hypothetical protein